MGTNDGDFNSWLLSIIYDKPAMWKIRRQLLQQVSGNILEIGFGNGRNLSLYSESVSEITALDLHGKTVPDHRIRVNFTQASAELMPFPDASFDTVITTFTLCSIADTAKVFSEIRRVLKPGGKYLFLEHGEADNVVGLKLQRIINPVYQHFSKGCSLMRVNTALMLSSGFTMQPYRAFRGPIIPGIIGGYLFMGVGI